MSKIRVNQLETLDGTNTVDVAGIVDDINTAEVTTSTGTQTLASALDQRVIRLSSIEDMASLAVDDNCQISLTGWHAESGIGGGLFESQAGVAKSSHDGASIISPTVPPVSAQAGATLDERAANYRAGIGETDPTGFGCFVALGKMSASRFGGLPGSEYDAKDVIRDVIAFSSTTGSEVDIDGQYYCSGAVFLKSNCRLRWLSDSALIQRAGEGSGPIGAFLTGDFSAGIPAVAVSNIRLIRPVIDCNNNVGENGIGIPFATDVKIFDPVVRNTLFSEATLGGRAFQNEGGETRDIDVYNPSILDCSIGINAQGLSGATSSKTFAINYHNVQMVNVDVPFNFDGQSAPPPDNLREMSIKVNGVSLRNCGRLGWEGADPLGGGIITADRGHGAKIENLRLINDPSYGQIGSILRGVMFDTSIAGHCDFEADFERLFDHSPRGFASPSSSSFLSTAYVENAVIRGTTREVLETKFGGAAIGAGTYAITIDPANVLERLVGQYVSEYSEPLLRVSNGLTGETSSFLSAKVLAASANNISIVNQTSAARDFFFYHPTVPHAIQHTLCSVALAPSDRVAIEASLCVYFPASGNLAATVIIKYLIAISRDGNGAFTSQVTVVGKAEALDSATVTPTLVVSDSGSNRALIRVNQSNNLSIALGASFSGIAHMASAVELGYADIV